MDHRRYGEAQQEPFRRAAGEAFQNGFELAACFFLERVSHQVHAEQEQREPAGQREYIENVHGILLFLQFLFRTITACIIQELCKEPRQKDVKCK